MQHLQTEGPTMTFEDWKKELIRVTHVETGRPEADVKLNNAECYIWWKDGFTPYCTFRETYKTA